MWRRRGLLQVPPQTQRFVGSGMNLWGVETLKGNKIGLKMDLQGITACARRGRPREASKGITKTTLTSACGALPGLLMSCSSPPMSSSSAGEQMSSSSKLRHGHDGIALPAAVVHLTCPVRRCHSKRALILSVRTAPQLSGRRRGIRPNCDPLHQRGC